MEEATSWLEHEGYPGLGGQGALGPDSWTQAQGAEDTDWIRVVFMGGHGTRDRIIRAELWG